MKHTYGRPGAGQHGAPTKPSEWDLPSQSGSFSSMFQQLWAGSFVSTALRVYRGLQRNNTAPVSSRRQGTPRSEAKSQNNAIRATVPQDAMGKKHENEAWIVTRSALQSPRPPRAETHSSLPRGAARGSPRPCRSGGSAATASSNSKKDGLSFDSNVFRANSIETAGAYPAT